MSKANTADPLFIGEHRGLDFLNSIIRPKSGTVDWLTSETTMLDWFQQSGLATEDELAPLRQNPKGLEQAIAEVSEFRERFRDFITTVGGQPQAVMGHPIVDEINQILKDTVQVLQVEEMAQAPKPNQVPYELRYRPQLRDATDLLPRVAAVCAQLICEADFRYIKNCEGPDCSLYFLDVSKSHKRRWCSMDLCGNRAKAATYRNR